MRVKILVANSYDEMEVEFEKAIKKIDEIANKENLTRVIKIKEVKIIEKYDFENDNGFISYHIFYTY